MTFKLSQGENIMRGWLAWLLALTSFCIGITVSALGLFPAAPKADETQTTLHHWQSMIERTEQVVLLTIRVAGIAERSAQGNIWGVEVPGSSRTTFLQYSYNAQLGIDGSKVTIETTADNQVRISVPDFIFIGHDDEEFKVIVENNGALSGITPKIDTAELITEVLNEDTRRENVASNIDLLRSQTEAFYTAIVHAVDPEVELVFKYPQAR